MRTFGKWLGRVLLALILLVGALWIFGPREDATFDFTFDPAAFGEDLDAYFADAEARFDDLRPGVEKRVLWAEGAGQVTPLSLVYLHGFSASSGEMQPVPRLLAQSLGANLVYTRLQGHGRTGPAMAEATVAGWTRDTAEAISAARAVGEQVIVISLSTGGTLAAAAALEPGMMTDVKGLIFVAPNFAVNSPLAPLLTWPAARYWLPLLAGENRSWEPRNDAQALYWTSTYPNVAVLPMAALVQKVTAQDFSAVQVPALFWYAEADKVVRAEATSAIAARWGGPVQTGAPDLTPADDVSAHNIVGEILSPNQTEPALSVMLPWIEALD